MEPSEYGLDFNNLTQSDFFEITNQEKYGPSNERASTITPNYDQRLLKQHMNYSMVRVFKNYMKNREDIYGLTKYRKECLRVDEEYDPVFSDDMESVEEESQELTETVGVQDFLSRVRAAH
jgi:hypothetical protein